jgi:hypothetical protein
MSATVTVLKDVTHPGHKKDDWYGDVTLTELDPIRRGVTQGGRSPIVVASNTRRRKIHAAAMQGVALK